MEQTLTKPCKRPALSASDPEWKAVAEWIDGQEVSPTLRSRTFHTLQRMFSPPFSDYTPAGYIGGGVSAALAATNEQLLAAPNFGDRSLELWNEHPARTRQKTERQNAALMRSLAERQRAEDLVARVVEHYPALVRAALDEQGDS